MLAQTLTTSELEEGMLLEEHPTDPIVAVFYHAKKPSEVAFCYIVLETGRCLIVQSDSNQRVLAVFQEVPANHIRAGDIIEDFKLRVDMIVERVVIAQGDAIILGRKKDTHAVRHYLVERLETPFRVFRPVKAS